MAGPDAEFAAELDVHVPPAAWMWNYWMGGKDNYPADRAAGDAVAEVYPEIDVGTGLPTVQNTHEVAQAAAPESRIVYVDNDPMVLAHARALLTSATIEGLARYVHANYHDPAKILAGARDSLDFTQPIAVMFMGVMGYTPDLDLVRSIVGQMVGATTSGSYLVLWDGTNTTPAVAEGANKLADSGGVPYILRSPDELARCFDSLTMVEPGLVPITQWRPEDVDAQPIDAYGAVARRPRWRWLTAPSVSRCRRRR